MQASLVVIARWACWFPQEHFKGWLPSCTQEEAGKLQCKSVDTIVGQLRMESLPEASVVIQISAAPLAISNALDFATMRLRVWVRQSAFAWQVVPPC